MVRNYVRKSERKLLSETQLEAGKRLVADGYSIRAASKRLGVNETTLRRNLAKGTPCVGLGRFQKTFDPRVEKEICDYLKDLDNRFYGIPKRKLGPLVFQYAQRNGIPHPFNVEKKTAGRDWVESFLKRNSLSLRTPQKTSIARIMGFNKEQVDIFFANFVALKAKLNIGPNQKSQIYNMDEVGCSTVECDICKCWWHEKCSTYEGNGVFQCDLCFGVST